MLKGRNYPTGIGQSIVIVSDRRKPKVMRQVGAIHPIFTIIDVRSVNKNGPSSQGLLKTEGVD